MADVRKLLDIALAMWRLGDFSGWRLRFSHLLSAQCCWRPAGARYLACRRSCCRLRGVVAAGDLCQGTAAFGRPVWAACPRNAACSGLILPLGRGSRVLGLECARKPGWGRRNPRFAPAMGRRAGRSARKPGWGRRNPRFAPRKRVGEGGAIRRRLPTRSRGSHLGRNISIRISQGKMNQIPMEVPRRCA